VLLRPQQGFQIFSVSLPVVEVTVCEAVRAELHTWVSRLWQQALVMTAAGAVSIL